MHNRLRRRLAVTPRVPVRPLVRLVVALAALALLSTPGCRRRQPATPSTTARTATSISGSTTSSEPAPRPADWPRVAVIAPGTQPALYLNHLTNAPALGYVNPGVRIRIDSAPMNGRVKATIAGQLPTRAWVPLSRVALYAQRKGRVQGTRGYVGTNDLVSLVEPGADGTMRVQVFPWFGGGEFLGPFHGTLPLDQLGDRPFEGEPEALSAGQCYQLPADTPVPIHESPSSDPIAELPSLDPPLSVIVLRERDGWFGVRAGYGPYITGYVQGALTPCAGELPPPTPIVPASDGERPYWMAREDGALYRVAAQTPITFGGNIIARLSVDGWARELGRQEGGQVDAFVAVDNNLALRGLVPASALTLVEAGAEPTPPPPEPEPEAPLPDELQ